MKKILLCITLWTGCLPASQGQRLSSVDTGKFRINLPNYWKSGNKIWEILSDKLPLVCGVLKDKELCGDDCNPRYSIEFEMTPPVIFSYSSNHVSSDYTNTHSRKPSEVWDFKAHYSFECYLLLLDDKNNLLTKFVLVDNSEEWIVTFRETLRSYAPPPPQVQVFRRNSASRSGSVIDNNQAFQAVLPTVGQEGQTPYSYINSNKDKLSPTNNDMFLIVDRKIKSW